MLAVALERCHSCQSLNNYLDILEFYTPTLCLTAEFLHTAQRHAESRQILRYSNWSICFQDITSCCFNHLWDRYSFSASSQELKHCFLFCKIGLQKKDFPSNFAKSNCRLMVILRRTVNRTLCNPHMPPGSKSMVKEGSFPSNTGMKIDPQVFQASIFEPALLQKYFREQLVASYVCCWFCFLAWRICISLPLAVRATLSSWIVHPAQRISQKWAEGNRN